MLNYHDATNKMNDVIDSHDHDVSSAWSYNITSVNFMKGVNS